MCDNRQNSDAANTVNSEDNKCIAEKAWDCVNNQFSNSRSDFLNKLKQKYEHKSDPNLQVIFDDIDSILNKAQYVEYINLITSIISRCTKYTTEEYIKRLVPYAIPKFMSVNDFKKSLDYHIQLDDRNTQEINYNIFSAVIDLMLEMFSSVKYLMKEPSAAKNNANQSSADVSSYDKANIIAEEVLDFLSLIFPGIKSTLAELTSVDSSADSEETVEFKKKLYPLLSKLFYAYHWDSSVDSKMVSKEILNIKKELFAFLSNYIFPYYDEINSNNLTTTSEGHVKPDMNPANRPSINREGKYNLFYLKEAEWKIDGYNDAGQHEKKLFSNIVDHLDLYWQNTQRMKNVTEDILKIINGENLIKDDIIRLMSDKSVEAQINFVISFLTYYHYESTTKTTLTAKMALHETKRHISDLHGETFDKNLVAVFFMPLLKEFDIDSYTLNPILIAILEILARINYMDSIFDYDKQIELFYKGIKSADFCSLISDIRYFSVYMHMYCSNEFAINMPDLTDEDFIFIAAKLKESCVTPESINALKVTLPNTWKNKKQKDFCNHFISIRKKPPFYSDEINKYIRNEKSALKKDKSNFQYPVLLQPAEIVPYCQKNRIIESENYTLPLQNCLPEIASASDNPENMPDADC